MLSSKLGCRQYREDDLDDNNEQHLGRLDTEAVARKCFLKRMFLKCLQNS